MEKKKIEERKTALQNQHEDVAQKINQGKNALGNLEATLMGLKGAISQIDWVLGLFVDETNKKDKYWTFGTLTIKRRFSAK